MAVKKVSEDAKDDRYYVVLYNPGGGQYKKVIHGKRAADRHEADMRTQLAGGGVASASDRTKTVRELMTEILTSKRTLAANTRRNYEKTLNRHVYPAIGSMRVSKLETGYLLLSELFAEVEHQTGSPTRHKVESLVRTLCRTAVRQGILTRNPLDGVAWGKQIAGKPIFVPEMEDVQRVRAAILKERRAPLGTPEMVAAMADVLIGTGIRIGELVGLSPDDIDHKHSTVTVRRQVIRLEGEGWIYAPPKTDDSGPRTIPVPKFVLAAFAATKLRNGTRRITLPWEESDGKPQTHQLFFFSPIDPTKPYGPDVFSSRLARIGKRLVLDGRLHAHCYRHRYTTILHDAGVPQRVIDYVTGHLPAGSVSMRVYTSVSKAALARVPVAVDAAWQESLQGSEKPARGLGQ